MCPVYGLAESSVGLTCAARGRGAARRSRSRASRFERRAAQTGRGPTTRNRCASCRAAGRCPVTTSALSTPAGAIARRAHRRAHPVPRPVGHRGYFRNPAPTRAGAARRLDGLRRSRLLGRRRAVRHRPREGPHHPAAAATSTPQEVEDVAATRRRHPQRVRGGVRRPRSRASAPNGSSSSPKPGRPTTALRRDALRHAVAGPRRRGDRRAARRRRHRRSQAPCSRRRAARSGGARHATRT